MLKNTQMHNFNSLLIKRGAKTPINKGFLKKWVEEPYFLIG